MIYEDEKEALKDIEVKAHTEAFSAYKDATLSIREGFEQERVGLLTARGEAGRKELKPLLEQVRDKERALAQPMADMFKRREVALEPHETARKTACHEATVAYLKGVAQLKRQRQSEGHRHVWGRISRAGEVAVDTCECGSLRLLMTSGPRESRIIRPPLTLPFLAVLKAE